MKRLILICPHEEVETLENRILLYEIDGIETIDAKDPVYAEMNWYEDEKFEPLDPGHAEIHIYASDQILGQLKDEFSPYQARIEVLEDVNWNQKWADSFQGVVVAEKIFVRPPWIESRPELIDLVIEPGMAFGTGTHETTVGSMKAILEYLKPQDRIIDVGSGSGVLSILAKILGASSVLAVEIDHDAVMNAMLNAELNHVSYTQLEGDVISSVIGSYDLFIANILPEVLVMLKPHVDRLLAEEGKVILSGILDIRLEELLKVYENYRLIDRFRESDWNTLVLERI